MRIAERRTVPPSKRTPSGVLLSCYPLEPLLTLGRMAALTSPKCLEEQFSEVSVRGAHAQVMMAFDGKECVLVDDDSFWMMRPEPAATTKRLGSILWRPSVGTWRIGVQDIWLDCLTDRFQGSRQRS